MFINNVITKAIPTAGLSFPLAEGSVVTAGGVTGIVMENVAQASPTAMIYIAIGGTIDLCSEANKGVSFTDEQIKDLGSDFNFIPAEEGGGGSSLPEVTAEDNGDVLTVVDGEWAKAEAPSGGGLVVSITQQGSGPDSALVMDKTYSQIVAALNADIMPIFRFEDEELGGFFYYTLVSVTATENVAYSVQIYCPAFADGAEEYSTESADGYPSYSE